MKTGLRIALALLALLVLSTAALLVWSWAPDLPTTELEQRWAQPPSTFIEVQGLRVHLRDEGPRDDPTPLVLVHGTSASLHTWDGWADAEAAFIRTHRPAELADIVIDVEENP